MTAVVNRFLQLQDEFAAERGITLSIGFDFHMWVSVTRAIPTKGPDISNVREIRILD